MLLGVKSGPVGAPCSERTVELFRWTIMRNRMHHHRIRAHINRARPGVTALMWASCRLHSILVRLVYMAVVLVGARTSDSRGRRISHGRVRRLEAMAVVR